MPEELLTPELEQSIDQAVMQLTLSHSQSIVASLVTYYKAGSNDVRKSRWTKQQQAAVDALTASHFGHLAEFDKVIGEQIKDKARDILKANGGYAEIKQELFPYIDKVFGGDEPIIINNVGKIRTEIRLDKNGKLYTLGKKITKPYTTNSKAYADMLSRTAAHKAWEQGRVDEYQRMGFGKWRFNGPLKDERTRPWHAACVGNVYEYGTPQSDYAMQLLGEPHCRHRAIAFFDDPDLDTPQEVYDRQKEKAGLYWDEDKEDWAFKDIA